MVEDLWKWLILKYGLFGLLVKYIVNYFLSIWFGFVVYWFSNYYEEVFFEY